MTSMFNVSEHRVTQIPSPTKWDKHPSIRTCMIGDAYRLLAAGCSTRYGVVVEELLTYNKV